MDIKSSGKALRDVQVMTKLNALRDGNLKLVNFIFTNPQCDLVLSEKWFILKKKASFFFLLNEKKQPAEHSCYFQGDLVLLLPCLLRATSSVPPPPRDPGSTQ